MKAWVIARRVDIHLERRAVSRQRVALKIRRDFDDEGITTGVEDGVGLARVQ